MNYLFLMKFTMDGYDFFIELGKSYSLEIHPNLSDIIWVNCCFCRIQEILFDIDTETVHLSLDVYAPSYDPKNKKDAINILQSLVKEFEEIGWYLNDHNLSVIQLNEEKI